MSSFRWRVVVYGQTYGLTEISTSASATWSHLPSQTYSASEMSRVVEEAMR